MAYGKGVLSSAGSRNSSRSSLGLFVLSLAALGCGGQANSRERREALEGVEGPEPSLDCRDPVCPELAPNPPEAASQAPPEAAPEAPLTGSACGADGVVRRALWAKTQADLDALEGCTRVASDFTVSAFRGMDGSPMRSLRSVDGTVTVNAGSSPDAPVLEGLVGLEQVGGLRLYDLAAPDLTSLSRLRWIGNASPSTPSESGVPGSLGSVDLVISNSSQLTSLRGLDALESVEVITLLNNPQLASLEGLGRAHAGYLRVEGCPLASLVGSGTLGVRELSISASALQDLHGFEDGSQLQVLDLNQNAKLESLQGLNAPERLEQLLLRDNPLVDLRGLEGLHSVGSLLISSDPGLPGIGSLSGLGNLEHADQLDIYGQSRLTNLVGLDALQTVGVFDLRDNPALATLTGVPRLRSVSGLGVLGAPALSSFTGLGAVQATSVDLADVGVTSLAGLEAVIVSTALLIEGAPQLRSLTGLPQLSGDAILRISDAPALTDLTALANTSALVGFTLASTGVTNLDALSNLLQLRALELQANPVLAQIDGAAGVAGLQNLVAYGNPALRRLPSFANVRHTNCSDCSGLNLQLVDNALLETGPGLPALVHADTVFISDNPLLASVDGLSALESVIALEVRDNPSLRTLDLSRLQLASSVMIRGNAALDDAALRQLNLPGAISVKVVSNSSGPSRLSPCPWAQDGTCDELFGDCAPRSDTYDCGTL